MILQALTRYYETLRELDEIAPRYYAKANVSFRIQLDNDGGLVGLQRLNQSVLKKEKLIERPQSLSLPEAVVRSSGILPNFLADNAMYLLGLDAKSDPERAIRCFESARELHLMLLDPLQSPTAKSICSFFRSWQPADASEHVLVKPHLEGLLAGGNIVFGGIDCVFSYEDAQIQSAWEQYRKENENEYRSQCLVTGLAAQPIERVHPKVKGVQGGQSVGTSLVSANGSAFESYGLEQNLNAPVSEYAAFAYTSALNHLIADFDRRMSLDGDTVVYWAETGEAQYQELFAELANPRATTEKEVSDTLRSIVNGQMVALESFNPETPFYVLCLSPNAARVSVRFFLRDTFGKIAENLVRHYQRLEIAMAPNEWPYLSINRLLEATVREKSDEKAASPLLAGATMRAILSGAPYPAMLYESILIRIRADRVVNRARAATIKAYLLQNISPTHPEYKEVLQVALNEQSDLKPYILGRLFAMLEHSQKSALGVKNATITDRYFDSASATPKLAFPTLLKLNRHHLAKDEKWGKRNERLISDIIGKLNVEDDPYPAHLTLEEQGLFVLGYYHQKPAIYISAEEQNLDKEQNENE